jgi:hypothetical protein
LVFFIIVYTLSSTKLEIRAKQFLLGSEGVGGRGKGWGEGREMTQTLCAHMNERLKKRINETKSWFLKRLTRSSNP